MAIKFDKYAQEGNLFMKELADALGHPDEIGRTGIILRAVLHSLRERITISESLNLISQFPMFLKGIYVDNWVYREKPIDIRDRDEFIKEVEKHQDAYGEDDFSWEKSTSEIIEICFKTLGKYISHGEYEDIVSQLPKELKGFFNKSIHTA